MTKDPTIAIRDCLAEIAVLHGIAAQKTLHEFRNDAVARRAAASAIQTISEAVRRIPEDWLADFPTEPWGQIKGIGNRLRHEYFRVDDGILWEIMTTDMHAPEDGQGGNAGSARRRVIAGRQPPLPLPAPLTSRRRVGNSVTP
jgi:uncharacterized protein with HEPN domain